jgi:hypothetical protein
VNRILKWLNAYWRNCNWFLSASIIGASVGGLFVTYAACSSAEPRTTLWEKECPIQKVEDRTAWVVCDEKHTDVEQVPSSFMDKMIPAVENKPGRLFANCKLSRGDISKVEYFRCNLHYQEATK